jgi:hypothetical protein
MKSDMMTKIKVIYENANLTQAYRTFDFESPWEETRAALLHSIDDKDEK